MLRHPKKTCKLRYYFGDRYPHPLSGGMRKRGALAQTLILDPDII